jgi:hypothetical protein
MPALLDRLGNVRPLRSWQGIAGGAQVKTQLEAYADQEKELRDANLCLAYGVGLGALGAGTALLAGATCPLCVVVAPALIGVGAWKRFAAGRMKKIVTDSEK